MAILNTPSLHSTTGKTVDLQLNSHKNDESKHVNLKTESRDENESLQLKYFACHCRAFYAASLSLASPTDAVLTIDTKHSKLILDVLENYSSFGTIEKMDKDILSDLDEELKSCGLDKVPENIQQYIDIRKDERSIAHEKAMRCRYELMLSHLPNGTLDDSDNSIAPSKMITRGHIRRSKHLLRTFVNNYYDDIGSHSFLAGFRKLIETQLQEDTHTVKWTFESVILSEQKDSYSKDAIEVLSVCAKYIPKSVDVDLEGNENNNIMELTWKIDIFISNDALQQLLSQLPSNFDARPKGNTEVIKSEKRANNSGSMDEWGLAIDGVLGYCDIL